MTLDPTTPDPMPGWLRRDAAWIYVVAAYLIAWGGVWVIINPYGIPGRPDALDSVYGLAFLAMAVGPPIASLLATAAFDGLPGVNDLFARIIHWRVRAGDYLAALLIVPATLVAVTLVASSFSPDYLPRLLTGGDPLALVATGVGVGLAAGWCEEIGWTGFAIDRLLPQMGVLRTGLVMGVIHGFWHLLIGFWGEGASFGLLYAPYFLLLWVVGLVALRLLIAWLYDRSESVLIAQLAHASYTGGLMILWPTTTSPTQITIWAGGFAISLLVVVGAVCWLGRRRPG